MKNCVILGLMILSCCGQRNDSSVDSLDYVEAKQSFYDPNNPDYTLNTWIRDPKNIKVAHETLKDFGYRSLYTEFEWYDSPCEIFGMNKYVLKPCNILVDSLILTYDNNEQASKYFKEFWNRRIKEGNDSIVYEVLKEIQVELYKKEEIKVRGYYVNDTIKSLLRIYLQTPTSDEQALSDFKFLKSIGLKQSAHNLLYEWTPYETVKWDKELLDKELTKASKMTLQTPVIPDNSK